MKFGIDVSENNGIINIEFWKDIKKYGVDFAIVRSTYGKTGVDTCFIENVCNATANGIKCGAFHYGYALNEQDARIEAIHCMDVIEQSGVLLELPVFYDYEDADDYKYIRGLDIKNNKAMNDAICHAWLDAMKYNKGLYIGDWIANYQLSTKEMKEKGEIWIASWSRSPYFENWETWQFTDKVNINGVYFDGDVRRG